MQTFFAARIFTGERWLDDHVITIDEHRIVEVKPLHQHEGDVIMDFASCMLVPAFIDAQVYGAAGKLFSLYPEPSTLQLMQDTFASTGTALFLPTIATNTVDVVREGISAIREYWNKGLKGVWGLHLEGPWINPKRKGAHLEHLICRPQLNEVRELLDLGRGVIRMITLAPECCNAEVIDLIRNSGVIISAGHSDATYDQAMHSFDTGISTVTHLYNAMSPLHHREPGVVGAAFQHPGVMSSIIPDGYHVDYAAIKIAAAIMGDRVFAITDAVTGTGDGPYRHYLAGDKYECNGILSGSALSMHQAFVNLVKHAGLSREAALQMCSLRAARMLGAGDRYGKIAKGYAPWVMALSEDLKFVGWLSAS